MSTIGARLEFARKMRDLSQNRLEQKAKISRGQVNYFCNDKKVPGVEHLVALAEALDVSLEWLATGRGQMHTSATSAHQRVTDARYPHLEEALALLGSLVDPEIGHALRARALSSDDDPPVEAWVEAALAAQKMRAEVVSRVASDTTVRTALHGSLPRKKKP